MRLSLGTFALFANAVEVSIVMAKYRVSSLKLIFILRLELCTTALGTRLAIIVGAEPRLRVGQVIFWLGSTTVLSWINATSFCFHVYVCNRLYETSQDQWKYVRSALNQADDLTRGVRDLGCFRQPQNIRWATLSAFRLEKMARTPVSLSSHLVFVTTR